MDGKQTPVPSPTRFKRVFMTLVTYLHIDSYLTDLSLNQESIMKTLASLLLISPTFAGTSAYAASRNLEPTNVPFQGLYGQVDATAPTPAQIAPAPHAAQPAALVVTGDKDTPVPHT